MVRVRMMGMMRVRNMGMMPMTLVRDRKVRMKEPKEFSMQHSMRLMSLLLYAVASVM